MDRSSFDALTTMAKLELDADERARLGDQLETLLEHFETLRQVDTDGVEASPYPRPLELQGRPDVPGPCLTQAEALANAPAQRAGHFLVPKVFDA